MRLIVANSFGIFPDGFNAFCVIILIKFRHELHIVRHKEKTRAENVPRKHVHYGGLSVSYRASSWSHFIKIKTDNLSVPKVKLGWLFQNGIGIDWIQQPLFCVITQFMVIALDNSRILRNLRGYVFKNRNGIALRLNGFVDKTPLVESVNHLPPCRVAVYIDVLPCQKGMNVGICIGMVKTRFCVFLVRKHDVGKINGPWNQVWRFAFGRIWVHVRSQQTEEVDQKSLVRR